MAAKRKRSDEVTGEGRGLSRQVSRKRDKPLAGDDVAEGFVDDVRAILREARGKAYAAANTIMVEAYWRIGRRIVEEEQGGENRAEYGSFLIRDLSRRLGEEFGRGVSIASLKNFRRFYLTFPDWEKGYALRSLLTWTHWRMIMRVDDTRARDYYIRECAEQSWTTRQLERAIASGTWERLLVPPGVAIEIDRTETGQAAAPRTGEFIKDPYILEFLDLPEPLHHEGPLEEALVLRLRDFLMELGKGFSFVGRQFRVGTETSDFYIDLVFYNYLLKCFALIDLKTRKLTHADIGQMDI